MVKQKPASGRDIEQRKAAARLRAGWRLTGRSKRLSNRVGQIFRNKGLGQDFNAEIGCSTRGDIFRKSRAQDYWNAGPNPVDFTGEFGP
jgi:hypothetical protein